MESKEIRYGKEELIKCGIFSGAERDMLSVLLNNASAYTIAECRKILDKESKRSVK